MKDLSYAGWAGTLTTRRTSPDSQLYKWCSTILEGGFTNPIVPKQAVVSLLNEKDAPCMTWTLSNVYPVKWEVGEFSATKNDVAIESITFCYNRIEQGKAPPCPSKSGNS